MEHHEIVIVGAGPAGLTAAKILGEGGKDVLVLEKLPKDRIGDKVCAGGIFRHGLIYIPKFLLEKSCDSLTFHVNGWATTINTVDGEPFLYTVDRLKLGQYQIGSDGSTSVIARGLGFYNDKAVCVEWYVEGRDEFEVIIDDALGMGVGYVFPHAGYTIVGAGTMPRFMRIGQFREVFKSWCRQHEIVLGGEMKAAPIKFNYNGFRFGDIFLVGDAASFNFTTVGEGIYQAMRSGEIAAKAIIDPTYRWKDDIEQLLIYHRLGSLMTYTYDRLRMPMRDAMATHLIRMVMGS
jgi:Dehydrogenases (flavoproteins)